MKNIKSLKEFVNERLSYNFSKEIDKILSTLDDKGIKYEDLSKGDDFLYFVTVVPFSLSFSKLPVGSIDVQIIVEVDGITDSLGVYDFDKEFDMMIDVISNFDYDEYKKHN